MTCLSENSEAWGKGLGSDQREDFRLDFDHGNNSVASLGPSFVHHGDRDAGLNTFLLN